MSEGLAAQISSIVRQHLADAHRMLGAMLAQLDGGGADLTRTSVPPPAIETGAEPTLATAAPAVKTPKRSTIERRERKHRAKLRQANERAAAEPAKAHPSESADPPGNDWPELRRLVRAGLRERGTTYTQIAGRLGAKPSSVGTWLSRDRKPPGAEVQRRMREWLAADPVEAGRAEPAPPYTLSASERAVIASHLSLANARELRERFNMTTELLDKAAAGEHLAVDIIDRLRGVLARNGAIAE